MFRLWSFSILLYVQHQKRADFVNHVDVLKSYTRKLVRLVRTSSLSLTLHVPWEVIQVDQHNSSTKHLQLWSIASRVRRAPRNSSGKGSSISSSRSLLF